MTETRITVAGCAGRMGRALVREIAATEGCLLAAATERPGNAVLGQDAGTLAGLEALGVTVTDQSAAAFAEGGVVIDFTTPESAAAHATEAAEAGAALVTGTTGLDAGQSAAVEAAAEVVAVVRSANMSLGVNLLLKLTRQAAAVLGPDFDIEITDHHHRHKVDAPSGTALALGEAAAAARGVALADVADRGRDGQSGPRQAGNIGFAVIRGGNIPGDHTVSFMADDETIELRHRAADRSIFARGAVRAALWLDGKPPGLYSMTDVLGLEP